MKWEEKKVKNSEFIWTDEDEGYDAIDTFECCWKGGIGVKRIDDDV